MASSRKAAPHSSVTDEEVNSSDIEESALEVVGSTPEEIRDRLNELREEIVVLKRQLEEKDRELEAFKANREPSPAPIQLQPAAPQAEPKPKRRRCLFVYNPIEYFTKLKGEQFHKEYPLPHYSVLITCFISAFIGVSIIGMFHIYLLSPINQVGWIGSMGAVATLVYGIPSSPLAQPRNVIGGNLISALIGVGFHQLFAAYPNLYWLAGGFAVAFSIVMMHLLRVVHPPGGATALIACLGPDAVYRSGWWYLLAPVLIDVTSMTAVSIIVTNFNRKMRYPLNWV